jgi:DNA-binding CsgD family transcriptional regulator
MATLSNPSLYDAEVPLTPCEFQVCFELVNTALVHKQIAAKLGKSTKTVEVQIASAYKKLGVTSRCELIQRFNSVREVQVKSLPSKGLVHRLMQRLDEVERVLNDLLTERASLSQRPEQLRTLVIPATANDLLGSRRGREMHRGINILSPIPRLATVTRIQSSNDRSYFPRLLSPYP